MTQNFEKILMKLELDKFIEDRKMRQIAIHI